MEKMVKIIKVNRIDKLKNLKQYSAFLTLFILASVIGVTFYLANSKETLDTRSSAAVGDSKNIFFTDDTGVPITETQSSFINVSLVSPWPTTATSMNLDDPAVAGEQTVLGQKTAIFKINSGSDDVNVDGNTISSGADYTWMGSGRDRQSSWSGYRFSNVSIPKGATIISAKMRIFSVPTQWIQHSYLIYGENSGNSTAFTNTSKPNQRNLTTAAIAHSGNTRWAGRNWHTLDEIKTIIQPIVNRSDWNAGNSLSIILKGTGNQWARKFVAAYELSPDHTPQLVVTYSTPDTTPTSTPVTPTNPPANPTSVITTVPTAIPTNIPPTSIPPTIPPQPTEVPYTARVELAENSNFTQNKTTLNYTSHPLDATYTFSNATPGRKTLYVRFTSSTGQQQVFTNWIDLTAPPTATPIPTTPPTGGGTGDNSMAMGRWTPDARYDTCTVAEHDSYRVMGPDGKWYPTWHPPVHTRADGSQCTFGHEHGRDPKGSNLLSFVNEEYGGILFGYANEKLDEYNLANNINNGMRHEDHVGHKIEWENNVNLQVNKCSNPASPGCYDTNKTNITCDFLMKVHQGTHSQDAFANNMHELAYFVSCNDGTKIASTKMVNFGNPGEFADTCTKSRRISAGVAPVPANSPSGGGVRFIGDQTCVNSHILVPNGQWSQYSLGLYEDWVSSNYLRTSNGTIVAYYDPHFAVFGPSRYFDPSKPNNVGRSIDTCYMKEANGDRARGGQCESLTNYKDGSTIPVNQRIKFDDPRSPFNGVKREFYFNQTWLRNPNGPTTWYTDPFGNKASSTAFEGSIKHYVAPIDNYNKTIFESQAIGANRNYGGNGVHAPN